MRRLMRTRLPNVNIFGSLIGELVYGVGPVELADDQCSAVQAPTWGYPTHGAYYRDAASVDAVLAIRIPFLAINAIDDPVSLYILTIHHLHPQ